MDAESEQYANQQNQQVSRTRAKAQGRTSVRIVPVVAGVSGRYERSEDLIGLWVGMIFMVTAWVVVQRLVPEPGGPTDPVVWAPMLSAMLAFLLGFALGVFLGHNASGLRRLFTSRGQMKREVAARAKQVFFDNRVRSLPGRPRILIFASLHERLGVVLAEKAVAAKVGKDTIECLSDEFNDLLSVKDLTDSVCAMIQLVAEKMSAAFPPVAEVPGADAGADALMVAED